jgi:hypothetical protein
MALDTVLKRASAVHIACPWRGLLPLPDGSVDQPDLQAVPFMYSGITAGEPVIPEPEPEPEIVLSPSVRTGGGGGGDGGHHWIFNEAERRKRQRALDAERERLERDRKRQVKELDRIISEAVNPEGTKKRRGKASDGLVADQRTDSLKEQISATERRISVLKARADDLRANR